MDTSLIDWNDVWKDRMNKCRQSNFGKACGSYWKDDDAARKYLRAKFSRHEDQIETRLRELPLSPESRVLDIGSGPGVLAIPLAEQVAHVTAVEPANGMINIMRELMSERGITNLNCVPKTWDDVSIHTDLEPPYDVVLASKSLGMFDIRDAILKMEAVASKQIHLYWFAGKPTWDHLYKTLWRELHQKEYYSSPKCDVLFNVLYQMGIYPQITTFPSEFHENFSSFQEAVEYFVPKFNVTTSLQEQALQGFLEQVLEKINGSFVLNYKTTCMHIWWEPRTDPK